MDISITKSAAYNKYREWYVHHTVGLQSIMRNRPNKKGQARLTQQTIVGTVWRRGRHTHYHRGKRRRLTTNQCKMLKKIPNPLTYSAKKNFVFVFILFTKIFNISNFRSFMIVNSICNFVGRSERQLKVHINPEGKKPPKITINKCRKQEEKKNLKIIF